MKSLWILLLLMGCRSKEINTTPPPPIKKESEQPKKEILQPKKEIPVNITTFAVQYDGNLNLKFCKRDVVFLDLFDYDEMAILTCQSIGAKVIAYFSSQYENWRIDQNLFPSSDIGKKLGKWKGERWIDTSSLKIRQIMAKRILLAKKKGFDGIDVDNVDSYSHKTGFNTSKEDSTDYINFFISMAHELNLSFSLKNSLALIKKFPEGSIDYYQNESCYKYSECSYYDAVSSPVFIIHYSKSCPDNLYLKAYTIRKKSMNGDDGPCE